YLNNLALVKLSWIFFLFSGITGFLVGSEFPLANKIYAQENSQSTTAGLLYAADLLGAWLAALTVSIVFIPIIGIIKTCILLLIIKIANLLGITFNR
ncbi:MAG: hypothetical protein DRP74_03515, partial [Candidatus Omnitrophota bacterium]